MQNQMENNEGISPEILPKEKVRILIPDSPDVFHYNAAVVGAIDDGFIILVREVSRGALIAGKPDKGNLMIYRSTRDKVEEIARIDLPHPLVSNWEDARAYGPNQIDDQDAEVLIGLTAIRTSDNKPVAATVRGVVIAGNFSIKPESLEVYLNDVGKNATPISKEQFLFRPNGSRFRHILEVVEHGKDADGQNKLTVKNTIHFPTRSWCEWQIGTQAQFLPGGILPIHGVNRFSLGIDTQGKEVFGYTYSMGLAQLDGDLNVIGITDAPLFTRKSFREILPMGQELDTNKDVIYCCGYSVDKRNVVHFIVNIGDRMTVEVKKSLSELQEALDKSSPIVSEEMPDKAAA
jgi:hypothetical protein